MKTKLIRYFNVQKYTYFIQFFFLNFLNSLNFIVFNFHNKKRITELFFVTSIIIINGVVFITAQKPVKSFVVSTRHFGFFHIKIKCKQTAAVES